MQVWEGWILECKGSLANRQGQEGSCYHGKEFGIYPEGRGKPLKGVWRID